MRQYLALNRFGLGARAGEAPPADPARWLTAQIAAFDPAPPLLAELPNRRALAEALIAYREEAGEFRAMRREGQADGAAPDPAMQSAIAAAEAERRSYRRSLRQLYIEAVDLRLAVTLQSPTPFMERWAQFWSNHFAVSVDKIVAGPFAGDYEFRAIRPHVTGRFVTLLRSAIRHPAMLLFLDQAESIGPNSALAQRIAARRPDRNIGLNENLAREILELHTLGVRTGYTQADVTAFAEALTGITIAGLARGPAQRLMAGAQPGETVFVEAIHQPGTRQILGRRYAQAPQEQADAILADLALHPATARNIATKLARHFVADDPPAPLIARLEADFIRSGGDLASLARTLIGSPEPWVAAPPKFKNPWDWAVSAMRGLGIQRLPDRRGAAGMFDQLGQPVWRPGSPAGYADTLATWAGPQALIDRVDLADRLAAQTGGRVDARTLAPTLLADALTPELSAAIARADSPGQGLALLLVAPAFLRR